MRFIDIPVKQLYIKQAIKQIIMSAIHHNCSQKKHYNALIISCIQNMQEIQTDYQNLTKTDIKKLFQICSTNSGKLLTKKRQMCFNINNEGQQKSKDGQNQYRNLAMPTAKKYSNCQTLMIKEQNVQRGGNFLTYTSKVQHKFQSRINKSYENMLENWIDDDNSNMQAQQLNFLQQIQQNPQFRNVSQLALHQNKNRRKMNKNSMDYVRTSKKGSLENNNRVSYKFEQIKKLESNCFDAPKKQKLYRNIFKFQNQNNDELTISKSSIIKRKITF